MTNFASAVDTTSSSSEGVRPQLSLDAKAAGSSGSGASCGSKEQYSFPVLEVTDAQELAKKLVAGGPTQGGKGLVGLKGEGMSKYIQKLWSFRIRTVERTRERTREFASCGRNIVIVRPFFTRKFDSWPFHL